VTVAAAPEAVERRAQEPRRRARELAVQMLYQAELAGRALDELADTFWAQVAEQAEGLSPEARGFATELATGTAAHQAEIDPIIAATSEHWRLDRMNVLDRIVLRLAIYELRHRPDTPPKVAINEAVELARTFGTDDSVRFVNGVLDAVQRRGVEG